MMEVMGLSAMLLSVHQPSMTARCNTQQCELCQGVERVDGRRGDAIDADVRGWMTGASAEQHVRHTAMRCCQHQLQGQGQRCTCMLASPTRTSCCGGVCRTRIGSDGSAHCAIALLQAACVRRNEQPAWDQHCADRGQARHDMGWQCRDRILIKAAAHVICIRHGHIRKQTLSEGWLCHQTHGPAVM